MLSNCIPLTVPGIENTPEIKYYVGGEANLGINQPSSFPGEETEAREVRFRTQVSWHQPSTPNTSSCGFLGRAGYRKNGLPHLGNYQHR